VEKLTLEERVVRHSKVGELLKELYEYKNRKYNNSFANTYEKFGPTSLKIRLDDKLSRLCEVLGDDSDHGDESAIDTLADMANYAIMGIMELLEKEDPQQWDQTLLRSILTKKKD